MLGVSFAWTEYGVREGRVVHCIRELLSLESQSLAIAYDLTFLAGITPVKKVAAIELQTRLVGIDLHHAAAFRLTEFAYLVQLSVGRGVQHPVVVVTASESKLLMCSPDSLPYRVRLAEIERSALHRHNLSGRDEILVHRCDARSRDGEDVVEDGASLAASEIVEGVVGKVHRSGLVRGCLILDVKSIVRGQCVGEQDGEIALETVGTVRRNEFQSN